MCLAKKNGLRSAFPKKKRKKEENNTVPNSVAHQTLSTFPWNSRKTNYCFSPIMIGQHLNAWVRLRSEFENLDEDTQRMQLKFLNQSLSKQYGCACATTRRQQVCVWNPFTSLCFSNDLCVFLKCVQNSFITVVVSPFIYLHNKRSPLICFIALTEALYSTNPNLLSPVSQTLNWFCISLVFLLLFS